MRIESLSRRQVVAGSVAAGLVAAPFVRSANAAGSLTIGLWDHWVPGANEVQTAIVKEWADKEKVDVKIDYITSQGNKLLLTLAAESQAKGGHDIMEFTNWEAAQPDNAPGGNADCVRLSSTGWADDLCTTPRGYVCEHEWP